MANAFSIILLALAVSLDSFSVGFTYGLRKMRIPFKSIAHYCLLFSFDFNHRDVNRASTATSSCHQNSLRKMGGVILIILGVWVIYQFFRSEKEKDILPHEKVIINLEIKSLGLVIHILKKPMSADFDKSGTITGVEAIMLGLALSLDAFGAGIGAVMLGFSPGYLALAVALLSSLLVFFGIKLGSYLSQITWLQRFSFLPGILLIIIGVWKI